MYIYVCIYIYIITRKLNNTEVNHNTFFFKYSDNIVDLQSHSKKDYERPHPTHKQLYHTGTIITANAVKNLQIRPHTEKNLSNMTHRKTT